MARTSLLDFSNTRLYKTTTSSKGNFTVNTSEDYIIDNTHNMVVGDIVGFTNDGGALPVGLTAGVLYQVGTVADVNNFTVTSDGYSIVDIISTGTGTHSYHYYNTNVDIENFIVNQDLPEERGFWHESILTGHREWITKGQHWVIEMKSNLFKESTLSTRRTNFDELFGYKYIDIYVSRCNEANGGHTLIRASDSVPVKFIMDKFETSFLTQANYEDIVTIRVRSKDYVDMSKTV